MKMAWALVCVPLLFGCDDDKKKEQLIAKTGASASATAVASAPPPAPAPTASVATGPKPLAERLRCDKLLSEKSLPGPISNYKVSQPTSACPDCGPTCALTSSANPLEGASIKYDCRQKWSPDLVSATLEPLKKELKRHKPVTEFGRGGIAGEKEN